MKNHQFKEKEFISIIFGSFELMCHSSFALLTSFFALRIYLNANNSHRFTFIDLKLCSFSFCFFLFSYLIVVLLDTTKEATLEWTRYPYGPQAQTPGVSIDFFFFFETHSTFLAIHHSILKPISYHFCSMFNFQF